MLSLILLYFSLFLQIFSQSGINPTINCENDQVYNSIKYRCEQCLGRKGINVCYSRTIGDSTSIFTFQTKPYRQCNNNDIATEVDGDGNILSEIVCAKKDFDFSDVDGIYKNEIENSNDPQLSIRIGSTAFQVTLNNFNLNYYRLSCLNGAFEKSCDYIANLYKVSIYSDNSFGSIITNLNKNLRSKNML